MIPLSVVEEYKESLMKMSILVTDLFDKSVYALTNRDLDIAKKVIEDDKLADEMRDAIVEKGTLIIGEYAPIGRFLVEIRNGILIANFLEMIGDNSKKISHQTVELVKEPMLKPLIDLPKMAKITEELLRKSMSTYSNGDGKVLDEMVKSENEVDRIYEMVEDELKLYMMESPKNVSRALRLMMISQRIEEIADLCLKIAFLYPTGGNS
ncbi:phosphate signaling complex PhoU family protein [Athalassotoga saccharophila]|uniref:phosphate signaling complex PhoU family protein n=1 Tax=Athalassotoga saccharophila TaxID=1441386 RepID=UPI00137A1B23|nr:PhoU domain-containing protein [Athalassotoga saccharophila]BBJ28103.1 phosphate-specific transport system accessory protein PhoU [Athalassotoga saccharophila]